MEFGNHAQEETNRLNAAPIEFDAVVVLDDVVALNMEIYKMPALKAGRLRRDLLLILAAPLFLAVVLVAFNLADQTSHRPPLADVFRFVLLEHPGYPLATVGIAVAIVVMQRLLMRPRMRLHFRKAMAQRPDVDKSDPRLPFSAHVIFSEDGIESQTVPHTIRFNWSSLTFWKEKDSRLMLLGDSMQGMCVSLAGLALPMQAAIRALVERKLGKPRLD
ncbi:MULTISPECIES: hypothetical protein [unclassified Achromobacter]|uniref:hypothetical protein n=1 Tax=unclassified Achromobacter TaxID=2626865 RepID=UPI000B519395|nr:MULTISPECIES: hypothetical protein [unclassified Achromobacter]OWT70269.1 hypothetical protein CEY05_26915 [Achromobacter sp. HZ34]OWT71809.1 hypothetical protein CEY04_25750 [Achromobacter sp. HZ28]